MIVVQQSPIMIIYSYSGGTAGHNALLVFTQNYPLFTLGSGFLGCSVQCQPIIISWVVALQLVYSMAMGAARKPQQYNYNSLWLYVVRVLLLL